jgi:hypothetical protein
LCPVEVRVGDIDLWLVALLISVICQLRTAVRRGCGAEDTSVGKQEVETELDICAPVTARVENKDGEDLERVSSVVERDGAGEEAREGSVVGGAELVERIKFGVPIDNVGIDDYGFETILLCYLAAGVPVPPINRTLSCGFGAEVLDGVCD